jgi:hypothetical protein
MRAAFLHNLTDAMASVGVIVSGTLILLFGWVWTDAVMTLLISFYVLWHGFGQMPKVIHLLMEGTPHDIEIETVIEGITQIKGQSVESLLKAVKENKETVELMEKNVRAAVVQNILSVIFAIDENDDRLLSKTETTNLIKSLREINGVMVDEKKFRAMIKDKNGSIDGVMDVIENMLDDSSSNEESTNTIFTFDES